MHLESLRHIREQAGYSQQDLADESGVSQHTISELELGRRRPQGRTLRKLAKVLGVEVADLRKDPESPKAEAPPSQRSLFNGLEEERRERQTVQDVRETYLPFRESLESYCARWERLLEDAKPLARQDMEEFVYTAVDLKTFLLAARTSELASLGEALLSAGEPFSAEKLQELSILRPAFERYYALMHDLVGRLPREEAKDLRPQLRSIQGEMTA
jgi:transcriptional regulator with XRE-family HTH domain